MQKLIGAPPKSTLGGAECGGALRAITSDLNTFMTRSLKY